MSFVETKLCTARQHCIQCRTLEGGRKWRMLVKRVYGADNIDFECPAGLPWLGARQRPGDLEPFNNIVAGVDGQPVKTVRPRKSPDGCAIGEQLLKLRQMLIPLVSLGCPLVAAYATYDVADSIEGVDQCDAKDQHCIRTALAKG